jgi:hypothetical protein
MRNSQQFRQRQRLRASLLISPCEVSTIKGYDIRGAPQTYEVHVMIDFLNPGIITIIVACCVFAGLKALIDWLGTKKEVERKNLTFMFVTLFLVNFAVLWLLFGK